MGTIGMKAVEKQTIEVTYTLYKVEGSGFLLHLLNDKSDFYE